MQVNDSCLSVINVTGWFPKLDYSGCYAHTDQVLLVKTQCILDNSFSDKYDTIYGII